MGWVGRAGLPFSSLHSDGWAAAKKLGSRWHVSLSGLLGRMGGPRPTKRAGIPLRSLHVSFLGSWVGWVGRGLGSRWAPFMFPSFRVLGRMGGPRLRSWASFNALQNSFLGSCGGMGKPRPRSWAPVGLPSCLNCLSGLLGRMGGPRPRSWAPVEFPSCFLLSGSWLGWVGRGKEAGLSLGSLHICFLGYWVGWVGRCQEARLPLGSLHVSLFLGSWIGWVGRIGLPSSFLGSTPGLPSCLHVSFLGCWVGWVGRGQRTRRPSHKAGLQWPPSQPRLLPLLSSLHVSFSSSWVGWVVHEIFIALYADKSLPTSFPRYARLSSCFFPHDSHTMRISSSSTAKSCAVCSSANLREKSGLIPCEETITATHFAYQTLLQQNPVQYARRRVCGKNRDRFRLKKPFCLSCKPTNLNPNLLQQTYAAEASMLQQLQQKCLVFRAWFQRRKKCRRVSSYCFCQV